MLYAIYLPNDNEKWFDINFSEKRAYWFAELNGLNPDDYDVRPVTSQVALQEAA
ncbi:MAG TPA: hypothetical protein VMW10_12270 [Alphaproteobacteria bacterium]|nr:hypothetical protein [Alphaproteobacteria bacterium]